MYEDIGKGWGRKTGNDTHGNITFVFTIPKEFSSSHTFSLIIIKEGEKILLSKPISVTVIFTKINLNMLNEISVFVAGRNEFYMN